MVKASHSVRDSDSQNLDFILSEKKCPVSSPTCQKISKERDKRQNFVQSLREKFHFSAKNREFNPQKSCALFYTTNQASHNELMPAIARSHEFRRSFGMVQNITVPLIFIKNVFWPRNTVIIQSSFEMCER